MKKELFLYISLFLTLGLTAQNRTIINVTGTESYYSSFTDNEVLINGKTDLHISAQYNALTNSVIRLNSENSWVFFDNIRPQVVIDSLLSNFYVNGLPTIDKENIRVAIYRHGAVVMPHSSSYQPIEVFTGQNFTGDSQKYSLFVYNNSLGSFDNRIRSFKLRRGYMATLANNADGTGYSRVFIASDGDLEVASLSSYLDQTVSFIRVFQWEWVSKKGWCQTGSMSGGDPVTNTNRMNATWLYTWSADYTSKPNIEYVPEKWQPYWPSWSQINEKTNITHVIGFNEPDHTEQSNVSVATAIAQWPEFMKSGLRIGSPACTDFSTWLYPFMDSIKAHNYRLDYVVIHAYWGGYTATQWYNALKTIHEKTGRPLWIKEWNNGATWTTETWPDDYGASLTKQYNELKAILNVMDTAHFVERYSLYNWVGYKRMLITDDGWITPAGELYRDSKPPLAFRKVNEVIPTYKFGSVQAPTLTLTPATDNSSLVLSWTNSSQEFAYAVVVEKKSDDSNFEEIFRTNLTSTTTYTDKPDLTNSGKFTYRVRLFFNNGTEQLSNEQSYCVVIGSDIQYGNLSYSNTDWNTVAFKNNYNAIPVVFTGAPTNNNTNVLLTTRSKNSGVKMMILQLLPWSYQNVATLTSEETIPYFVIKTGTYDFGGLKAYVSKTSVNAGWKTVNFPSAFDTVPVVLVSQTSTYNSIPTIVRVRNVTKTGFEVKLQKESKNSVSLINEIFAYMAIEQGNGKVNGNTIKVGRTAENAVGNAMTQYAKITYDESIAHPVFLAQLQTCNDDTVTAVLRCRSILTTEARVFKQREKSMGYTASATETAGYMLINPDVTDAVETATVPQLSIYPNPVSDKLFVGINSNDRLFVEIYNLYGELLKAAYVSGNTLNVSDLPTGCYLIKSAGYRMMKFIKL